MSRVSLGHVLGAFGIQGWIRIQSYTRPAEGVLDYRRWRLGDKVWEVEEGRPQGSSVVAKLKGLAGRDEAMALRGLEVQVERSEMPDAEPGEYYWFDLVGCEVHNLSGAELGQVESLFSNGAQDVLVIRGERERMVPFVPEIVKHVDLGRKRIVLDWEPEY